MKVSHFMSGVLVEPQRETIPSKGRFRDTAVYDVALNRDLDVNALYASDIFLRILASLNNQAVERMLVGGIACESDRNCVVVVVNTANIGRKLVTRSIFVGCHKAISTRPQRLKCTITKSTTGLKAPKTREAHTFFRLSPKRKAMMTPKMDVTITDKPMKKANIMKGKEP